ncbi:MAG TPA: acyltransferase [Gemmatimonadota bacterium]|nr:acyltransferase [Gemmatimonadota bacterium]
MTIIPLTPIDHIFTGVGSYPIEFVFAYDGELDADRLGASLRSVVEHFPPLSSRLVRLSETAYGLQPAHDGLEFQVVTSDAPLDLAANAYDFLNPVDTTEGQPLARLKLTHTPRGSVLGVSISHAVVDGFSYFYFLSSWARLYHDKPFHPPSHQRELLIPTVAERDPLTPDDLLAEAGAFWAERRSQVDRQHLAWETIQLPRQRMNELLQEGQRDVDVRLSHNDVITAHLWRKYVPQWSAPEDGDAYISCPVDFRRALRPFPPTYFGCAVSLATDRVAHDQLAEASLGQLALKVRAAVARVDRDYVERANRALETLRQQQGLPVLERLHVIHPHSGLLVTNLSRLPVNEIQFDAGPPASFAILTPAERGAVVLPAADGVEVRICLPVGNVEGGR